MNQLRQRLNKLEACRPREDNGIFIGTGVPRGDGIGDLAVAVTLQGTITGNVDETDAQFRALITAGRPCGR